MKLFKTTISKFLILSGLISTFIFSCKKNDSEPVSTSAINSESNVESVTLPYDNTHIISQAEADFLIERFKNKYPNINSTSFWTKNAVKSVLNQPGVARVRYYFGSSVTNQPQLFLLGVNSNGDDMIEGKIVSAVFANLTGNLFPLSDLLNNQLVNLAAAATATKEHRRNYNEVSFGGSFTQDAVRALLVNNASAGVRADIGLNDANQWTIVLRAVASDGTIIINGLIIDKARMCPPDCGEDNILNASISN